MRAPDTARIFPGTPESVPQARAWVAGVLAGTPAVEDAELMASELAANAILHSASGRPGGAFVVTATTIDDTVRIDVIDQGAKPPGAEPSPGLGQGTAIVRELADAFGADGVDRWFTVSTGERSASARAEAYRAAELEEAEFMSRQDLPEAEVEAGI